MFKIIHHSNVQVDNRAIYLDDKRFKNFNKLKKNFDAAISDTLYGS